MWIDFASIPLTDVLARPGTILAVATGDYPARVRDKGALTIYWDMYLNKSRVGLPNAPAPADVVADRANRLFNYASQQSSCSTPWIAENELAGAGLETPWSATNAQYRQNVLTYLKTLAARGARPFLLVSGTPYTAGDAAAWWQQVAAVADIVRETYFNAKSLYARGAILANRTIRQSLRNGLAPFLAIGIPPSRLGTMLGFQTSGSLGRAGLQPTQAWLEVVKWQALAARQVAKELGIATIWSWGWGEWTAPEQDPDKAAAACVWLWTRTPVLCDGPAAAGPGWDASRTEGQLDLPRGVRCTVGDARVTDAAISQVEALTKDRELATSIVFARAVEARYVPVAPAEVLAAEQALVAARFGGSVPSYHAALAAAGVSPSLARSILADELRRAKVARTLTVPKPTAAAVDTFYESYANVLVRPVTATPAPPWLGGRSQGLALDGVAPDGVFDLASETQRTLQTIDGAYEVRAVGDAQPLGTIPLSVVAPAIRAALTMFAQGNAFERWTTSRQVAALDTTTCRGDRLPVPGPVELDTFVPALSFSG
jgi:hypothetical protein